MLDHQLWLRVALQSEMRYIPQLFAGAHYHEDCKNLAQAPGFAREAYRVLEWMQKTSAFDEAMTSLAPYAKAGAERINGFYLLDDKQYRKSFLSYWRGFLLAPSIILPEWYRMVFAFFAPLGLERVRERRIQNRRDRLNAA
jgi:hypothetical protein